MLQLPQRLGLDLPDPLTRDRELVPDLLERVVGVHADSEAHSQHALLALTRSRALKRLRLRQSPPRNLADVPRLLPEPGNPRWRQRMADDIGLGLRLP